MSDQLLADDLEMFALEDAAVSLGVSHLLNIAAAAIRAQDKEITNLKRERDALRAEYEILRNKGHRP
ncbi:hypothetical protein HB779_14050 [Phyllobacterium sp. 628]|uniref:hypothetical protein n=1 Tax=Phyllobacterium sp. 628 TaxID=2718938 RepID=UPI0016624E5A|nr:hypothetical protein [Phyllobacterium sp. 628]QND52902.1 hypothetical protein HB779_14050 [Phyllobacterium sp. 628]